MLEEGSTSNIRVKDISIPSVGKKTSEKLNITCYNLVHQEIESAVDLEGGPDSGAMCWGGNFHKLADKCAAVVLGEKPVMEKKLPYSKEEEICIGS